MTEGPPTEDYGGNAAPGALTLSLRKGPDRPCVSAPVNAPLRYGSSTGRAWELHDLLAAQVVYPQGPDAASLLLIVTGSLNSGDGDQVIGTQLIACDAGRDAVRRVFAARVGHNENQEVRLVGEGPLRGTAITATPQQHPPFGFWIVVSQPAPSGVSCAMPTLRHTGLWCD